MKTGLLGVCVLLLFLPLMAQASDRLIPLDAPLQGDDFLEARQLRERQVRQTLGPHPARRDLLPQWTGDREDPQVLKVMVCRIAFESNRRPDLTSVPADGKFMAASDTIPAWLRRVDPAPHDRFYFDSHMEALDEFYRTMSYGNLELDWEIFPQAGGPFLMSDPADYGPGEDNYWTLDLLESFCREAVAVVDSTLLLDPWSPGFADYDVVLFFHAGSDLQSDLNYDSPNDLPSFNIFFGDSLGLPLVDGGLHSLASLVLLPETTTQDVAGEGSPVGALNAVVAHEFGHQLGYVDTYDTWYHWSVVGRWDLMDSGHRTLWGMQTWEVDDQGDSTLVDIWAYGALPASLAMWHREISGWVSEERGNLERLRGPQSDVTLWASNRQEEGLKAYRVDLSDSEYYLLENRQERVHDGGRFLKRDPDTGVFLCMSKDIPGCEECYENIGEYDFVLPQSGLLAWQIQERGLEELWNSNAINWDGNLHFRLVEADGLFDLGYYDLGSVLDPFYVGNNALWTHETTPSTRCWDGTPSGFEMRDLVTSPYLDDEFELMMDASISFRALRSGIPDGFPRDDRERVPEDALASHATARTLMPLGEDRMAYWTAVLEADSTVSAFGLFSALSGDLEAEQSSDLPGYPLSSASIETGSGTLWALASEDSLYTWRVLPDALEPQSLYSPVAAQLVSGPLMGPHGENHFVFWLDAETGGFRSLLLASGRAEQFRSRRILRREGTRLSPPAWQWTSWGGKIVQAVGDTLYRMTPDLAQPPETWPLPEEASGSLWLRSLDEDDDEEDELFLFDVLGRVWQMREEGALLRVEADLGGDSLLLPPIPADLDGDGRAEIFFATESRIHRYSLEGYPHTNWPLKMEDLLLLEEPMKVGSPLLAADFAGSDGVSELCFFSDTGHLLLIGSDGSPKSGSPRSLAGEAPVDLWADRGILRAISWKGYFLGFDGDENSGPAEWSMNGGGASRQARWQRIHELSPATGDHDPEQWILYPNPASSEAFFHHPDCPAGLTLTLELMDLEGQIRLRNTATSPGGPFHLQVDLEGLAPGVYFLKATLEGEGANRVLLRRLGVLR
ncbi:MAG: hypothetical protein QGG80_01660 [Candidatus Krumholzibacteria bacterium]|nr:hypothetical protein [Candidatus Krumholzibacteria bacterium]